jgi:hypothetical protein
MHAGGLVVFPRLWTLQVEVLPMLHHLRSLPLKSVLVLSLVATLTGCQFVLLPTPIVVNPTQPSAPAASLDPMAALPQGQSLPPAQLAIPAVGLEAPVTPMGWEVTEVAGEATTQWVVPDESVGWHVTSASAGAAGRVVLSGQQVAGAALLAPLAQGAVEPGQEILLSDDEGVVFVYRVTEVSEPIPLDGATSAEETLAASYVAPSDEALLTLITGWPDFTTTHRVFAVAELVGLQN